MHSRCHVESPGPVEFEKARKAAVRKAKFLGTAYYVLETPGCHEVADTVVLDAGDHAGCAGWEYDSDGSRRKATPEEIAMWRLLPNPPNDWVPED